MTEAQFASYIRKRTKTNSTTFTDDDILLYANIIKNDLAKEITKANEDYFGIEAKRDLEDGKRNYAFPTYMLNNMKYLQAYLNGKWEVLKEFDINSDGRATDEDSILANWVGKKPKFDIFGGEITIYSNPAPVAYTEGLKLWAIIYPADLTSLAGTSDMSENPTNTSFGMPTQFHFVWATKVIIEYKQSKEKPIPLTERELNVDKDLALALNSLKGLNLDRSVVATIPDKSNNGQDY